MAKAIQGGIITGLSWDIELLEADQRGLGKMLESIGSSINSQYQKALGKKKTWISAGEPCLICISCIWKGLLVSAWAIIDDDDDDDDEFWPIHAFNLLSSHEKYKFSVAFMYYYKMV
jgi:hypothetical protein